MVYKILLVTCIVNYFSLNLILGQTFGVIGDYGKNNQAELDVSNLIKSWSPDFIITVGDNNYQDGDSTTIDDNIGKYFQEFIHPYLGKYGIGASVNKFFPTLGNHDLRTANGKPYFDYFTLPGNERYYDFVWGNVHFFTINSDTTEVDGDSISSVQGLWLKNAMENSVSTWKIVFFHESPYTSESNHKSQERLQWPFKEWGATAVITGHSHCYERLFINGMTYIVNGLGGHSLRPFTDFVPGSLVQYSSDFGAMKVVATKDSINFLFINRKDSIIDNYTISSIPSNTEMNNNEMFQMYNFPNPFSSSTLIKFFIPDHELVEVKIYNLFGVEITTILKENLPSGSHEVEWKVGDAPKGVYYCCLYVSNKLKARKVIINN